MSITRKRIPITTAADGSFQGEAHVQGALRGVFLDLGDLSTPDLSITDSMDDTVLFGDLAIAADLRAYPTVAGHQVDGDPEAAAFLAPMIFQRAVVTIAGGGATKSGTLYLLIER